MAPPPAKPKLNMEVLRLKLASNQHASRTSAPEPLGFTTGANFDLPFHLDDDPLLRQLAEDRLKELPCHSIVTSNNISAGRATIENQRPMLHSELPFREGIQRIQYEVAKPPVSTAAAVEATEHRVNQGEALGSASFVSKESSRPEKKSTRVEMEGSNNSSDDNSTNSLKRKRPGTPNGDEAVSNIEKFKDYSTKQTTIVPATLKSPTNLPSWQGGFDKSHANVTDTTHSLQANEKFDCSDDWSDEGRALIKKIHACILSDEEILTQMDIIENVMESQSESDISPKSVTSHLYAAEEDFLAKVDRKIMAAETDDFLEKIGRKIDDAELNKIMDNIYQQIVVAEFNERWPDGKILWEEENLREPKDPTEQFSETNWDIAFYDDKDWNPHFSPHRKKRQGISCMVEDEVFFEPSEFVAIKILPKFIDLTDEHIFQADILFRKVVKKVKELHPNGVLRIYLRDHETDSSSVQLEARGNKPLVKISLHFIQNLVTARQLRYLSSVNQKKMNSSRVASDTTKAPCKLFDERISEKSKTQASDKQVDYIFFGQKVKDLKIKEHEFSAIPLTFIKSSMWERHKEDIGRHCDDKCQCPLKLAMLTRNVVGDFIRKQTEKDPNWKNPNRLVEGNYPVGFIENFIPKFLEVLRTEFPSENPKELYRRLEAMWLKHKGSIQYGITCRKNCHCGEGWEVVFKKGRCGDNRTTRPSKPSITSQDTLMSIPRNKTSLIEPSRLQCLPQPASLKRDAKEMRSKGDPKEFVIDFPSSQGMGFFCVTDTRGVCKIISVNTKQQIDARLAVGTIIVAAAISGSRSEWNHISSHRDIEHMFESAKQRRELISVRFINSEVKATDIHQDFKVACKDWGPDGVWRGKYTKYPNGWAGGAALASSVSSKLSEKMTAGKYSVTMPKLSQLPQPLSTPTLSQDDSTSYETKKQPTTVSLPPTEQPLFEYLSTQAIANHRMHGTVKPILRMAKLRWSFHAEEEKKQGFLQNYLSTVVPPKKNPKISFGKQVEKRFYNPSDTSIEMMIPLTKEAETVFRESSPAISVILKKDKMQTPSYEALLDAVNSSSKSYTDLFELLKGGANPTMTGNSDKTPESYIKDKLISLNGEMLRCKEGSSTWTSLNMQFQESDRKKKLLKIYTIAQDVMNQARFLKCNERLDIQLACSESLSLTELGLEREADDFVWWDVYVKGQRVPRTQPATLSSSIDWLNEKDYHCNENLDLAKARGEERKSNIVLILNKGNPDSAFYELGRKTITLREIRQASITDGKLHSDLESSKYLNSCRIILNVKRRAAEKDYREKKRQEATKKLKDLLQQIDNFVIETGNVYMESLAAEIRLSMPHAPAMSLLHAAIYLDEPDYVEVLMKKYGADPHSKKSRETPLALAEKKFDKVLDDIELKKKRCRIHGLLLGKSVEQLESEMITNSSIDDDNDDDDDIEAEQSNVMHKLIPAIHTMIPPKHSHQSNIDIQNACTLQASVSESFSQGNKIVSSMSHGILESSNSVRTALPSNCNTPSDVHWNSDSQTRNLYMAPPSSQNFVHLKLDWMQPKTRGECLFFNKPGKCRHHHLCEFSHIQPSLGNIVDQIEVSSSSLSSMHCPNVSIRNAMSNGEQYFTAGYLAGDGTRYYAEGGRAEKVNGISWYRSKWEAENALLKVVFIHQNNLHQKPYVSYEQSRALPGKDDFIFRRLIDSNLSNIYVLLYKSPLRRDMWTMHHKHDLFAAEFTADVDGIIQRYQSAHHPGGEYHKPRWWYKTEKEAKASAFDCFLDHAAERGMVNHDKLSRIDGTRFVFS